MFQQLSKLFSGIVEKPAPESFNPNNKTLTVNQLLKERRRVFTARPRAEYKIGTLITNNNDTFNFLKGRTNYVALCWVGDEGLNVAFVDSTGVRFLDLVSIATQLKDQGIYSFRWVAQGNGLKHQSLFSKVESPNPGSWSPFNIVQVFTLPMLGLADEDYTLQGDN